MQVNNRWVEDSAASSGAIVSSAWWLLRKSTFTRLVRQKWEQRSIGHDTCGWRIRPLLCRLGLSRTEEGPVIQAQQAFWTVSRWGRIPCVVTAHGYASPAQAEFFESMGLFFSDCGQEETRRFIHEAKDFVVFSSHHYKFVGSSAKCTLLRNHVLCVESDGIVDTPQLRRNHVSRWNWGRGWNISSQWIRW